LRSLLGAPALLASRWRISRREWVYPDPSSRVPSVPQAGRKGEMWATSPARFAHAEQVSPLTPPYIPIPNIQLPTTLWAPASAPWRIARSSCPRRATSERWREGPIDSPQIHRAPMQPGRNVPLATKAGANHAPTRIQFLALARVFCLLNELGYTICLNKASSNA
jgi:hypothetical protein